METAGYRLPLVVERVDGYFQTTSPALDGFLVLADTLEEALTLTPGMTRAFWLRRIAQPHQVLHIYPQRMGDAR